MKARELMQKYAMEPHVENGSFLERHYPAAEPGRPESGSIFYYVAPGEHTEFHRIDCDEYWCYNAGEALEIWSFGPDGTLRRQLLGTCEDAQPFAFFRRGEIFASRLRKDAEDGCFVTCITVPRFCYEGFELFEKEKMIALFPEAEAFWK